MLGGEKPDWRDWCWLKLGSQGRPHGGEGSRQLSHAVWGEGTLSGLGHRQVQMPRGRAVPVELQEQRRAQWVWNCRNNNTIRVFSSVCSLLSFWRFCLRYLNRHNRSTEGHSEGPCCPGILKFTAGQGSVSPVWLQSKGRRSILVDLLFILC